VTKYRKRVFTSQALDILKEVMQKVCEDFGVELGTFEGEDNHVHLLVNYPPQIQLSKLVNSLKGDSGRISKRYFRFYSFVRFNLVSTNNYSTGVRV
jgi:putative transposase